MKTGRSTILALAALLCAAAPASAQVVYDNGGPNGQGGNEMTAWAQAEDFSLAAPATIGAVRFWGVERDASSYQGSIFWAILANDGAQPGSVLASGLATPDRVAAGSTYFGTRYQYDFSIAPLALSDGVYWLALHNGPLATESREELYWETTGTNATLRGMETQLPDTDGWSSNGSEHAFLLSGAQQSVVPEPGTVMLTATGLLGLGLGVSRRRRRTA